MTAPHDKSRRSLAERILASVAACRAPSTPMEHTLVRTFPLDLAEEAAAALSTTPAQRPDTAFKWPSGTRPVLVELLNGDMRINDDIEDAPLITIQGHNGVSAKAWLEFLFSLCNTPPSARAATDFATIEEAFPLQGDFAQDAKYTWPSRWQAAKENSNG